MTTDLFHWSDEFSVGLQEIDELLVLLVDFLQTDAELVGPVEEVGGHARVLDAMTSSKG